MKTHLGYFYLFAALAVLPVGLGFWWLQSRTYLPYRGYTSREKTILIERGQTISQVADNLEHSGVIESSRWFLWHLRIWFPEFSPKAGEYRFDRALNWIEVGRKLHRGDIHFYRVTIPEGLTKEDIVVRLNAQGFGDKARLAELVNSASLVSDLDPAAWDLEGYLFPETYLFSRQTDEYEIVRFMVDNLRRVWTGDRQKRAEDLGFNLREVLSLASLIEKETALESERRLVSAVFHNRLHRNMRLECDPTVIYAVKQVKEYDGVIHQSDLKLDSPYNTYLYPGLPPGPIGNPGLASIDAALYPAPVDYLFFVARDDGSHIFSTNYSDHNRAVQRFQRNSQNSQSH